MKSIYQCGKKLQDIFIHVCKFVSPWSTIEEKQSKLYKHNDISSPWLLQTSSDPQLQLLPLSVSIFSESHTWWVLVQYSICVICTTAPISPQGNVKPTRCSIFLTSCYLDPPSSRFLTVHLKHGPSSPRWDTFRVLYLSGFLREESIPT